MEHDGEHFGHSSDEEITTAANSRTRRMQDNGRACQVRLAGDLGAFGVR